MVTIRKHVWIAPIALAAVALTSGCAHKKTAVDMPAGVQAMALPPTPSDVLAVAHCTDEQMGVDCSTGQYGQSTCINRLRADGEAHLYVLLEKAVDEKVENTIDDEGGNDARAYISETRTTLSANVRIRVLESNLFLLQDGRNYAMRFCTPKAETDFNVLTALEEGAKKAQRTGAARAFQMELDARFPKDVPDHKETEKAERLISEHFQAMYQGVKVPETKKK